MSWLDRLEKKWQRFAIPNLTVHIIFAQFVALGLILSEVVSSEMFLLVPVWVLSGEVWRLLSFVAMPPDGHPFFIFFAWYIFWIMGSALENQWGEFRFNLFLIFGYVLTVASAFLAPYVPASTTFLAGSVFLAFAHLFPDFQLLLFFVLPVKVRWLAWLAWAGYIGILLFGDWPSRFMVVASLGNYFLFFGRDIYVTWRFRQRRVQRRFEVQREAKEVHHTCRVCGLTDKNAPQMDFRYCSKCADESCYCMEHLRKHEHVAEAPSEAPSEVP
jgi:hypothetical protein